MHAVTNYTTFLSKPHQIGAETLARDARGEFDGFAIFGRNLQVTMEPAPHTPLPDMTAVLGSNRPSQGALAASDIDSLL